MKCSEVCQEGTLLWRCKAWLSVWWPLSGGSSTPPVIGITLLGANWKREVYLFMYLLLSGCCDAEWGTTASWVSARLSVGLRFVSWLTVWQTLVSVPWPEFTWVVPLNVVRLLACRCFCRMKTLIQGILSGLLRTCPEPSLTCLP